jgi:RNA polymerase sigma factor (sigma-70 family)
LDESSWLAAGFAKNRKQLRSVAYRMLGSLSEADDAVQEAWLRLSRSEASHINNLGGWLTTVVARISLDVLRARRSRIEGSASGRVPDPIIVCDDNVDPGEEASASESTPNDTRDDVDPEHQAIMAESISLALLVVLETLDPAERLAFVLHDMFDVPFDEIAPIVGKTPAAARQLASRARRRVQGATTPPDADFRAQREVVEAFVAAARGGDLDALLRVLDPDVVVRSDEGARSRVARGAVSLAKGAMIGARLAGTVRMVVVNGAPGFVTVDEKGAPHTVQAFTVRNGRITEICVLADPDRLRQLDLSALAE